MEKRHVWLATPTLDRLVNEGVVRLHERAIHASYDQNCPWRFTTKRYSGLKPIDYAMNRIAGDFLASDAEILWNVDSDQQAPDHAIELLDAFNLPRIKPKTDIVGGVIPIFREAPNDTSMPSIFFAAYTHENDGTFRAAEIPPDGGFQDVDGVGGGAMAIHRRVLEDERLWNMPEYHDMNAPPIFRNTYVASGRRIKGWDLDFCYRAMKLKYRIRSAGHVMFGHSKTVDLTAVMRLMNIWYDMGKEQSIAAEDLPTVRAGR